MVQLLVRYSYLGTEYGRICRQGPTTRTSDKRRETDCKKFLVVDLNSGGHIGVVELGTAQARGYRASCDDA